MCKKCESEVIAEDAVMCYGDCGGAFHFICAQVREVQFRKRSPAEKQQWMCIDCKTSKINKTVSTPSLDDVYTLVMNMSLTMSAVQKQLTDISTSQQYLSDGYDEIRKKFEMFDNMNKEIDKLKKCVAEKDKQLNDLATRVVHVEQYSRRKHIEFTNVICKQGEDVDSLVINVAKCVGVNLTKGDIQLAHRLPTSGNKTPVIIAELTNRYKRDELIINRYKSIISNKSVVGNDVNNSRIFINESLSPYFKNLFYQVKMLAKEKGYKFVWYRNYKILVKKNEEAKEVLVISDVSQISKLQ